MTLLACLCVGVGVGVGVGIFACLDVSVCVDDIYMRPVCPSFINYYVTGGIIYICLMSRNYRTLAHYYRTVYLFICLSII